MGSAVHSFEVAPLHPLQLASGAAGIAKVLDLCTVADRNSEAISEPNTSGNSFSGS